jgi:hypothetical protein
MMLEVLSLYWTGGVITLLMFGLRHQSNRIHEEHAYGACRRNVNSYWPAKLRIGHMGNEAPALRIALP